MSLSTNAALSPPAQVRGSGALPGSSPSFLAPAGGTSRRAHLQTPPQELLVLCQGQTHATASLSLQGARRWARPGSGRMLAELSRDCA
eukprot:CAMPEP_0185162944 /NCGR_PEP_ID=MMETSP1139-20130426/7259_1 /TAXON_ID=298111 /ORGANISM="Pavlova sp., Strain CCMP459" /LENGTH=87 /DNA_ID=CAMNT_0027728287 /DNA_START=325 /DNA_END=589 /DNA_ORIENTATION=+